MKYAYVVTRTVKGEPLNVVEIPNLGVHTSYEKARQHFDSVRLDRIKSGLRNLYTHPGFTQPGPVSVLRTSLFYHPNGMSEEIRLEKWVTGKKSKPKFKKVGLPHPYICFDCANQYGGKWPDGHCATAHTAECSYCKKEKQMVALTDFLWNGDKTLRVWD